jgi:hypothetical protein
MRHDTLTGWMKQQVDGFASWLTTGAHTWEHGARGVIGEWGVPGPGRCRQGRRAGRPLRVRQRPLGGAGALVPSRAGQAGPQGHLVHCWSCLEPDV